MKVLTIANRKGGAGKSTCAAHLSLAAVNDGMKVVLIDMDPQKTLEFWWSKRSEENPFCVDAHPQELFLIIEKLKEKDFDLCIIDTPGDASENALVSIDVADLILIPAKPTAPDLTAIGRTLSMMADKKKNFFFTITQGVVNSKSTLNAASVLSDFGPVAPALIYNRLSYAAAMGDGSSAISADKNALAEISIVWNYTKKKLFDLEDAHKNKLVA